MILGDLGQKPFGPGRNQIETGAEAVHLVIVRIGHLQKLPVRMGQQKPEAGAGAHGFPPLEGAEVGAVHGQQVMEVVKVLVAHLAGDLGADVHAAKECGLLRPLGA